MDYLCEGIRVCSRDSGEGADGGSEGVAVADQYGVDVGFTRT